MQSVGRIVKNPFEIADGNSDAIRIFSFLKNALSFDHIFSIGFRSGLYGGKMSFYVFVFCELQYNNRAKDLFIYFSL